MSHEVVVAGAPIRRRIPVHIYSRQFQYTPAVLTNVQATWEKHGWVKPDPNRHHAARLRLNRFW